MKFTKKEERVTALELPGEAHSYPVQAANIVRGLSPEELERLIPELCELHRRSGLLLETAIQTATPRSGETPGLGFEIFSAKTEVGSTSPRPEDFIPQPDGLDAVVSHGLHLFLLDREQP